MPVSFPNDFLWGAATAAYQIEGGAAADGKGPSVWDVFSATPGKIRNGDRGDVACDHYHRWADDVSLMQQLGLRGYRFSISWPRVRPQGRGADNPAGWDFYDRLVDALLAVGITPMVTLYHWDLPAALQMELGGWGHADVARHFADYAQAAFARLGDRVPWWITLNEPWCAAVLGHVDGCHAPGSRDEALGYRVAHNLLRAHALAVAAYRASPAAGGAISMALNMNYAYPATDTPADRDAAERAMVTFGGWFGDPAVRGDYPAEMRTRLGGLLPEFTAEETRLLRGSLDYLALNHYTSDRVRHAPGRGRFDLETIRPDAPRTHMDWPIVPDGLRQVLHWFARRYPGLPLYITENGAAFEDPAPAGGGVADPQRVAYLREHFLAAGRAREEGVDLRGYFVWSLMDNFEWAEGFAKRFGLIACDYATQRRTIKDSGRWYADVIATGRVAEEGR